MKTGRPAKTIEVPFPGLDFANVVVAEAVPKFNTSAEVIDYSTAFYTSTATISNGSVTPTLGAMPVYVEVLQ